MTRPSFLALQSPGPAVKARAGERPWDNATGVGAVAAKQGLYHDAIVTKRNEFWLVVHEIFGGLNPEGVKLFNLYRDRARRK